MGDQVAVKVNRGRLAAAAGQSPHGWGIAIDLCRSDYHGVYGDWFKANAAAYGWIHPYWATTSLFEPWHWEYGYEHAGGGQSSGEVYVEEPPDTSVVPDVTVPDPVVTPEPEPQPSPSA